jgi:hypothetical protein
VPDEGFRLPDSSYDQLTKIIMAYGAFPKPVPPSEVGKAINIHPTTISRNGAFLVEIGVLEGARSKGLTPAGRSLSRALEHEMPDELRRNWREILASNDFMQKILSAVRIRRGMERSALQAHIAYSAGQPRTDLVLRGANAVIDILRAGELLREDDGKLAAVTEEAQRTPDRMDVEEQDAADFTVGVGTQEPRTPSSTGIPTTGTSAAQSGPTISIQVQIHCNVNEIDGLGLKLRKMLDDLAAKETEVALDSTTLADPVAPPTN